MIKSAATVPNNLMYAGILTSPAWSVDGSLENMILMAMPPAKAVRISVPIITSTK